MSEYFITFQTDLTIDVHVLLSFFFSIYPEHCKVFVYCFACYTFMEQSD